MYNIEVSLLMARIADLLEIEGGDEKLVCSYRRAVQIINRQELSLAEQYETKSKITVASLEPYIKHQIEELFMTGHCTYYHYHQKMIPEDVRRLLSLPGVKAKTLGYIYRNLHLTSFEEIAAWAVERRLRCYPMIGVKTEQNLLRGIRLMQGKQKEVPLSVALPIAQKLLGILQYLPEVKKLSTIGSVRRMKEIVNNIDLLVATQYRNQVLAFFGRLSMVEKVLSKDLMQISVLLEVGIEVNLYVIEPQNYLTALHYYTGTEEYKDKLSEIAQQSGLKMTKQGIYGDDQDKVDIEAEADIFDCLHLPYIPPELQENKEILQAIDLGQFPKLVEMEDIQGDLHMHTKWSDGANSLEEMLDVAKTKEYQYMAVTDHSQSLVRARGLDSKRLEKQWQEIDALNDKEDDFYIFKGSEVDILADGTLDFDDSILRCLEVVGGSIHTYFRQDEKTMTDRITNALKNPYLTFLGHPTGRLLGRRYPYPLDFDRILSTAQKMDKFLEINSSPDRLDLNDQLAQEARKAGVPIVINTDAHHQENLNHINFGVTVARKAWLEDQDVVNTLDVQSLKKRLQQQRNKR